MSTGWICPKCNAVMAPHISVCINCKGNQSYTITSIGTSSHLNKEVESPKGFCGHNIPIGMGCQYCQMWT